MITITLTDPYKASDAGVWCTENFGFKFWKLDVENLFTKQPKYNFSFKTKQQATLFALKWYE